MGGEGGESCPGGETEHLLAYIVHYIQSKQTNSRNRLISMFRAKLQHSDRTIESPNTTTYSDTADSRQAPGQHLKGSASRYTAKSTERYMSALGIVAHPQVCYPLRNILLCTPHESSVNQRGYHCRCSPSSTGDLPR